MEIPALIRVASEVTETLFAFLSSGDVSALSLCCRQLYNIGRMPLVWRVLLEHELGINTRGVQRLHLRSLNAESKYVVPHFPTALHDIPRDVVGTSPLPSIYLGADSKAHTRPDRQNWPAAAPPDTEHNTRPRLRGALTEGPPHYGWHELFRKVYHHRVAAWASSNAARSEAAQRQADPEARVAAFEAVLTPQLHAGAGSGHPRLMQRLAADLLAQAHNYVELASKYGGDPFDPVTLTVWRDARCAMHNAIGCGALATLLYAETSNYRCHAAALELSSRLTTALGGDLFLQPGFDLDEVYDEIQCFGSLRDRAGFLFRAQFWQPASFTLRVHQYTVCDLLRFWPARVMHDARRCAQHESQRLAADAWILNDMRKTEEARRLAELALSQVPACVCHRQSPPFSESRDDVKLVPTAVWVPAGPSYFPNPPLDIGAPPPPFTVNFSLSGMDHLGSADGAFQGPVSASPLPVVRPRPFPFAAAARRVLCDACRRPLVLTAAESAVYFTLGFIAHPSSDALDAYIVNLRSCLERGRRAIACNNIGTIFTRRGDHGTATLWHRCALRLNPNFFLPYRNLSKGLLALDDHHSAAAILDEALFHCHPSPPEAIFERLRMSVNRTATDAAEATLRRIIALHPRWSLPYRLLALLVEARGCPLRAAHILTEVINVGLDPADLSMRARLVCRNPSSTSAAAVDMRLAATLAPDVAQFTRWIEESAPSSSFVWTP